METIGALILAAGGSSRLGQPKQLLQFRGQTLLRRSIAAAIGASCSPVVVVIGAERAQIVEQLDREKVFTVENADWQRGIGSSIRVGLRESLRVFPQLEAVILLACDQPLVDRETISALKRKREETKKPIVASSYANTLGIPALFDWVYFDELFLLENKAGAKSVILKHPADVAEYAFPDGAIDIDTLDDYQKFQGE